MCKSSTLFVHQGEGIGRDRIAAALKDAGLEQGDTIFVHSDVSVFGKLAVLDTHAVAQGIIGAFRDAVGPDGCIIMPTFSYSFCRNEIFDVETTESTVGFLTEQFRKSEGVERSGHPIFSVAVWGERGKKEFLLAVGRDSFDDESVFGKMMALDAKIVFFGAGVQSCTFVHYIEQKARVGYRYFKTFSGTLRRKGNECADSATYFVRHLDRDSTFDGVRLGTYLRDKRLLVTRVLGCGLIQVVSARAMFRSVTEELSRDSAFLLKH